MLRLLPEAPAHIPAREKLLDRCFGPARHLKTCEMLRRGRQPADGLAFSLLEGRRLVGTLRFWHIRAGDAGPALLLGPIAVDPLQHGNGLGSLLMRHGLAEAARRGHTAVLLVGDAPYYERFGFRQELTVDLAMPGPVELERFLGLELEDGALFGARGPVVAISAEESRFSTTDHAALPLLLPSITEPRQALIHAAAR